MEYGYGMPKKMKKSTKKAGNIEKKRRNVKPKKGYGA